MHAGLLNASFVFFCWGQAVTIATLNKCFHKEIFGGELCNEVQPISPAEAGPAGPRTGKGLCGSGSDTVLQSRWKTLKRSSGCRTAPITSKYVQVQKENSGSLSRGASVLSSEVLWADGAEGASGLNSLPRVMVLWCLLKPQSTAWWVDGVYKDLVLPFLRTSLFLTYPRFLLAVFRGTEETHKYFSRDSLLKIRLFRKLQITVEISIDLDWRITASRRNKPKGFGRGYLLWCELLAAGVRAAQPVLHPVPVLQLLDLINSDQPVLWCEGLLQVLKLNVLVANLCISCPVKARGCPEVQLWTEKRFP